MSISFKIGEKVIGYSETEICEEYVFNGEKFITISHYRKLKIEKIKEKLLITNKIIIFVNIN